MKLKFKMRINKIRFFSFIATLLVGVDVFQVFGVRIAIIPLLFCGFFLLYKRRRLDISFLFVFLFFAACLPSVVLSQYQEKSIGYLFWIFFNYFSVLIVYKELVLSNIQATILGVKDSYRFQIIIGSVLFFFGLQFRAQVFYYEPSYFSLSLVPYIVIVFFDLFKRKTSKKHNIPYLDIVLLFMALYTTKSANMILVFILAAVVISLQGEKKVKNLIVMCLMSVILWFVLFWYSMGHDDLLSTTFQKIYNATSFSDAILERTGNRWPRMQLTIDTAIHTFWGIGIGTFKEYSAENYFPFFLQIPAYYSPLANEAINIYFEIAATCGWLALTIWLVWHFSMIRKMSRYYKDTPVIVCSLIVAMLALSIESNFLRPYYWMLLGMAVGQVVGFNHKHKS